MCTYILSTRHPAAAQPCIIRPNTLLYVCVVVLSVWPFTPNLSILFIFRRRLLIWRAWAFGWHLEDWIRSLHAHVRFADAIYAVHHSSDEGEKVESLADYSAVLYVGYIPFIFFLAHALLRASHLNPFSLIHSPRQLG
jgi:hypothetical protein